VIPRLLVAIDTGGTFTDAVAFDPASGQVSSAKALTSYHDLTQGILESADSAQVDLALTVSIKHGTTQVINALLQRDGARTALVTTSGFKDVLELRRGNRPVAFDLSYSPDEPLVPRDLCFEVSERMDANGRVVHPLDESEVESLAGRLADLGIEAVAVSFLNSYANPEHELRTAELLRKYLPGSVWIATGSDASREWYEYERTSTAVANAYVAPRISTYVAELERRLAEERFRGALYLMASHGGVLPASHAASEPTALVESGPIGGVIGAGAFARALGIPTILAFDMGGTTAKCAIVQDGAYDVVPTYFVGGYEKGFPIRARVLDIVEVGSGGGSIASVDAEGRLSVGPRSAGSHPGPVAFGRGGTEPTVTDANLLLGRIAPGSFLNGEFALDLDGAADSLTERIANPLGYQGADRIELVAKGILEMATLRMVSGIKQVSLDRGFDLGSIPILVFGGGGPLHGVKLAQEVGAGTVIVPPLAGNFSAVGMLMADARIDDVRTYNHPLDANFLAASEDFFREMEAAAATTFAGEMQGVAKTTSQRFVGLRFAGQRDELNIALMPSDTVSDLVDRYLETYRVRFGHSASENQIEVTVLRTSVVAPTEHLSPEGLATWQRSLEHADNRVSGHRRVVFDTASVDDVPVMRRERLAVGFETEGPVVIEEYGATSLVPPDWHLRVGVLGELWLTKTEGDQQ
jgi:N-methylhydantoinase A